MRLFAGYKPVATAATRPKPHVQGFDHYAILKSPRVATLCDPTRDQGQSRPLDGSARQGYTGCAC